MRTSAHSKLHTTHAPDAANASPQTRTPRRPPTNVNRTVLTVKANTLPTLPYVLEDSKLTKPSNKPQSNAATPGKSPTDPPQETTPRWQDSPTTTKNGQSCRRQIASPYSKVRRFHPEDLKLAPTTPNINQSTLSLSEKLACIIQETPTPRRRTPPAQDREARTPQHMNKNRATSHTRRTPK